MVLHESLKIWVGGDEKEWCFLVTCCCFALFINRPHQFCGLYYLEQYVVSSLRQVLTLEYIL